MSDETPTPTATRERPLPEGVQTMAALSLGGDFRTPDLGELSIGQLAWFHRNPDAAAVQTIDCACSKCGCAIQAMALFSNLTACDPCREQFLEDERMNACKSFWEEACPADLRSTDTKHDDFPKAIYEGLRKSWTFTESLFLYGPTRKGKTRCATMLMRRALLGGKDVGFCFPEELKDAANSRERLKVLRSLGARDLLLIDDAVLACCDEPRAVPFLRDLIDYMMRHGRAFILTSQVGEADLEEAGDKFGKLSKSDREGIKALFGRIRERCRIVPFAEPETGTTTF